MKKKIIISVIALVVVILGFICYLNLFDTLGLVYLQKNENIKYANSAWNTIAVVSDTGNCYIGGDYLTNEINYGVENIRKYKNRPLDKYVRIYDKGDAKSIKINYNGGTIVTKNNEVYIFINNNEDYKTPTYLCKGYTNAVIGYDSKVYMLSGNGDLVYVNSNTPQEVNLIGNNIKEFNVVEKNNVESLFALTNDGKLYILNTNEQIKDSNKYFENISDFDVLVPHQNMCVLSILENNNNAYVFMEDSGINYESFTEMSTSFKKVGENISSVTSYGKGIAMMDNNSNVSLYGSDLDEPMDNWEFHGEVVFNDVESVFGGHKSLMIIKNNGEYYHYGAQLDSSIQEGITPK